MRPVSVDASVNSTLGVVVASDSRPTSSRGSGACRSGVDSTRLRRRAGSSSACPISISVTARTDHSVAVDDARISSADSTVRSLRQGVDHDQRKRAAAGKRGLDEEIGCR